MRTRTRSSSSGTSGVPAGSATARTASIIASTARTLRPRTVSRHAASFSGVARATILRATVHETSPTSTAARSRGRFRSACHTRAHSRTARAPTPTRSRLQSPSERKPSIS